MSQTVSFNIAFRISGIGEGTLRNIYRRAPELFASEYFSQPTGRGAAGAVKREGVIFLAIFGQLLLFGLSPKEAAEAAWMFTDVGDLSAGREPCELYREALTLLLVVHAGPRVASWLRLAGGKLAARLVSLAGKERLDELLHREVDWPRCQVAAILNINAIVSRVDAELAKLSTEQ